MKSLYVFIGLLAIFHVCNASIFQRAFPGRRLSFLRRPKVERVSEDRNLTLEDKQNAKRLGANVCPKRVFLQMSFRCIIKEGEKNCSRQTYYRTSFTCCPGYEKQRGLKGCPRELYTSSKSIAEVLTDLGLTTLVDLAKKAGLAQTLQTKAPLTVFAPTNEAFTALPAELLNTLTASPQKLKQLLLFHVLAGKVPSRSLEDESVVKTLDAPNAVRINVLLRGWIITVQGARVTKANQGAKNGIIHVIDKVMTPATQSSLELIKKNKDLSEFYNAIVSAKIKFREPMTIFAPTNAAFRKMKTTLSLTSKECLKNLLKYHMVPRARYTTMISKKHRIKQQTVEGSFVVITRNEKSVTVNNVTISKADISTTNGVMHIINDVLITNSALTLLDVAKRAGATEIVNLIKMSGLDKVLSGEKKFTLFAPSNEAIKNLPSAVQNSLADPDFLKSILLYHVVKGEVGSDTFENEKLIDTLSTSKSIRVNNYNYGRIVTVQGGRILPSKFDLKACNGYVHVMDKVILPPRGNIVDVIETDSQLSTLSSLLEKAGLKEILRNATALTLFAPTNKAFSSIPKATLERLLDDNDQLINLLKYHVFRGTLYSNGLFDSCDPYSLNGELVNVKVTESDIKINDAMVTRPDMGATNGVVHVINAVLEQPISPFDKFFLSFGPF